MALSKKQVNVSSAIRSVWHRRDVNRAVSIFVVPGVVFGGFGGFGGIGGLVALVIMVRRWCRKKCPKRRKQAVILASSSADLCFVAGSCCCFNLCYFGSLLDRVLLGVRFQLYPFDPLKSD